jgi:hypothetical protein
LDGNWGKFRLAVQDVANGKDVAGRGALKRIRKHFAVAGAQTKTG